MKFQTLISRVSVVLFAAALTMTSCTKDENVLSNDGSSDLNITDLTFDDAVQGSWSVTASSEVSVISFDGRTGSADVEGMFSIELNGNVYSDFEWSAISTYRDSDPTTLQLSYGQSADMTRTYDIVSFSEDHISLSSAAGIITLRR